MKDHILVIYLYIWSKENGRQSLDSKVRLPKKMTLSKTTFPTDLKYIPTNRLVSDGLLFAKRKVQNLHPGRKTTRY